MPNSKKSPSKKKLYSETSSNKGQVDVIFGGPLLFVPAIKDGDVTGMEVYSPCNGHPVGAVFLPEVWFSDAELNDPECARWPHAEEFSLLDPHSYSIELKQDKGKAFPVKSIPAANHKVKPGRKMSHHWEVAIAVNGQLAGWESLRPTQVKDGMYYGSDSPTTDSVASMQRLTYKGVKGADFCGAPPAAKEYLKANAARGGSLIVMGEIPFHPTLLHEREAVAALAKLAGLDLHLISAAPTPRATRVMQHTGFCGLSVITA